MTHCDAPAGEGRQGDPCLWDGECAVGHSCLLDGRCSAYCVVGPAAACAEGTTCGPPEVVVGTTTYGHCS